MRLYSNYDVVMSFRNGRHSSTISFNLRRDIFLVFQSPTIEYLPESLPRNRFSSSKGKGIQRISLASSFAQVRETRKYVRPSL